MKRSRAEKIREFKRWYCNGKCPDCQFNIDRYLDECGDWGCVIQNVIDAEQKELNDKAFLKHKRKIKKKIFNNCDLISYQDKRRDYLRIDCEKLLRLVKAFTGKTDWELVQFIEIHKANGYERAFINFKESMFDTQLNNYITNRGVRK